MSLFADHSGAGIMYFAVIFVSNLVTTLIFVVRPDAWRSAILAHAKLVR